MNILKLVLVSSFLFLVTTTFSFANDRDREIRGTVDSIDASGLTFVVKGDTTSQTYSFRVDDSTDIELEARGNDKRLAFSDLKVGDNVKVEYYPTENAVQLADEIDIYR